MVLWHMFNIFQVGTNGLVGQRIGCVCTRQTSQSSS